MRFPVIVISLSVFASCCDPPSERFSIDRVLTEMMIANTVTLYTSRSLIPCEAVCDDAYRTQSDFLVVHPDSCSFHLDSTPGMSPDAEVGWVKCSGMAWAYSCE